VTDICGARKDFIFKERFQTLNMFASANKATCVLSRACDAQLNQQKTKRRSRVVSVRAQAERSRGVNASGTMKSEAKMRVTRMRDLVEISPHNWVETASGAQLSREDEIFMLGLAQGQMFKEFLLESPHFRVYSYNVLPTGEHSVKFLMGSPRMEGLDDVARVTTVVANADEGLINLVPETNGSGFVAEIRFPLPALETRTKKNEGMSADQIRSRRLHGLVRALEEQVIDESLICLMEKGSDDRSVFSGPARLNKYYTGMRARPSELLHRGTCTSSSPTAGALQASRDMLLRLWALEEKADGQLSEEVRERVTALFCDGAGQMIIHPSGTDAEMVPLLQAVLASRALKREAGVTDVKGKVINIVCCAGEVGSGTRQASEGAFFSKSVPLGGNTVADGQELPAIHKLCDMKAIELVARSTVNGDLLEDYDQLVESTAREALASDPTTIVVVHTVAGSKTGLCAPSPGVAERLKAEFGDRLISVLDACQMRSAPSLIPRWLREQGPVLMTSSKFYGGPSFGSGVFLSHRDVATMNEQLAAEPASAIVDIAEACASYLTSYDVGQVLPRLHDALPPGFCNTGLLLRWAAGLYEMESLNEATIAAGGVSVVEDKLRSWVFAMREEAQQHAPDLEFVQPIDYENEWQYGGVNTIVSVRLRNAMGEYFSTPELKQVYGLMHADISEFIAEDSTDEERRVAAKRCLTGQPVDIPEGPVLRTVLGAAQLTDLVSGAQSLENMMGQDRDLFCKLALIARQFDHLISYSL